MDKMYKTFRPEIKAVDTEDGSIDMLIPMSTASIDRDGESIDPAGWKKSLPAFRKRPVLLSSHDYGDLRKQIGEFTTIKVADGGLVAKPRYYINEGNEEADWAFKLASKGMAAYSVGFIPTKWVDGDGEKGASRTYTEQELLEISHVVVPSNRDAIQGVRGKSVDPVLNEIIDDVLKDADLVVKEVVATTTNSVDDTVTTSTVIVNEDIVINSPRAAKHSQCEIEDELDYLLEIVKENGLSDRNKLVLQELVDIVLRVPGSDIPAEIVVEVAEPKPKPCDDTLVKRIIEQTIKNVVNKS